MVAIITMGMVVMPAAVILLMAVRGMVVTLVTAALSGKRYAPTGMSETLLLVR